MVASTLHKKVRGVYENGELRFAEPVDVGGSWKVEITFLEEETGEDLFESDPHSPEARPLVDPFDERHRHLEPGIHTNPV